MPTYVVLALTNPVEGREAEFNKWYNEIAVPVYKTIPGLEHLGRFRVADVPKQFDFLVNSNCKYLSICRFSTDDYDEFAKRVEDTIKNSGTYYFSNDIDQSRFSNLYLSQCQTNSAASSVIGLAFRMRAPPTRVRTQ